MPFLNSKRTRRDEEPCWVCLDAAEDGGRGLVRPCKCPRLVHPLCLARWQLRSAGKGEETHCRFCSERLPDWRQSLTPQAATEVRRCGLSPPATMTVAFNGQSHELEVHSGPEGFADFLARVRSLFGLDTEQQMDLTFDCAEPATGQPLQLNGSGAFDAAVHCAAMAAASRARKRLKRSAIARRLLAPFARSASCPSCPIMEATGDSDGMSAEADDNMETTVMSSAASSSSLASTALAGPDAHINVQPATLSAADSGSVQDFELPGIETAKAPLSPFAQPSARWGLSPDCERLLWR